LKQRIVALLGKHGLWDGKDLARNKKDQLGALLADLRATTKAGKDYRDRDLQVEYYRWTLTHCIQERTRMAESLEQFIR
jgi:hypothetical protein